MKKRFNITGVCFPEEHYMVNVSNKINDIFAMVDQGDYFVINRPRQYGKTTTLYMLNRLLKTSGDFFPISTSFEGIGEEGFANAAVFIKAFFLLLTQEFKSSGNTDLMKFLESSPIPDRIDILGVWISELVEKTGKKIVLMIDEVDKSSNNQLFLDFLGMLRNKYLKRREPGQRTFHSVILAGVHDVKSLKAKFRKDTETKFNSPWNIAVDFKVDLSFSVNEIQSMLEDYSTEQQVTVDIPYFAEQLFYLTSGYPFLVSRLCKIIDEEIQPGEQWTQSDIDRAANILLTENNTNFQSLIKNLENNQSLYDMVYRIVLEGENIGYNLDNPLIEQGVTHGVFRDDNGRVRIHNRLYEQRIYNYMASKVTTSSNMGHYNFSENFLEKNGILNMKEVLLRFQTFLKEQYSEKDLEFLERNGRLLFLAFLRPIINGKGFDFKEVEISEEKRLDIVVTFGSQKYIIELKKWYGEEAHGKGLNQLKDYLDRQDQNLGFLIIYDSRRQSNKIGQNETVTIGSKQIFMVWV